MSKFLPFILAGLPCFLSAGAASAQVPLLVRVGEESGRQGVCRKVVITPKRGEEVTIVNKPEGNVVEKAEPFSFYFLLKEDDQKTVGNGDYLRVGNGLGKPVGYVRKDVVTYWDTLFCIEPFIGTGDNVFRVSLPGGDVAEFVSSAAGENVRCFVLSADVKSKDIKDEDTPYDVLLYSGAARRADATREEQEAIKEVKTNEAPLEIVFVIDTTKSMEPLIEVAKSVARDSAKQLSSGKGETRNANVRFGLVEYRDAKGDGDEKCDFDSRVPCKLTKDVSKFVESLNALKTASTGSGDFAEAVGKGLETALDEQQIGWSEYGNRQIVLLGDAPNKSDHGPKMEAIAARCNAPGKTDGEKTLKRISVQAIVNGGDSDAIEQFTEIAEATNQGEFFFRDVRAADPADAKVAQASQDLASYLQKAFVASAVGASGDAKALRNLAKENPENAIVQRQWAIFSQNGDPKETPELFHKGNVSIRADSGKLVGARKVLVLESTLRRLGPNLESFVEGLAGQDVDEIKNPELILELLQGVLARQITGDRTVVRATALKDIISHDLPIQTPSLAKTADDIARMTNDDFESWKSQITAAATIANTLIKEAKWLGAGEAKYAFVDLNKLP